jgi:hypothetical protein
VLQHWFHICLLAAVLTEMSLDLQKGRDRDREVALPEREYRIKGRVVMWISSYVGICNEASEFFCSWYVLSVPSNEATLVVATTNFQQAL